MNVVGVAFEAKFGYLKSALRITGVRQLSFRMPYLPRSMINNAIAAAEWIASFACVRRIGGKRHGERFVCCT
jgi:hypothetical protein